MAKKQIGILTFWYAVNPGSALQAYSLWRTISSLSTDIECHLINYQHADYRNEFLKFPSCPTPQRVIVWLFKRSWYRKYEQFWKGMKSAVKPTCRLDERKLQFISGYDSIVAGSDQIWNTKLTYGNYIYFLPFISGIKKISYAASIGMRDFPEEDKNAIAGYLKDFDHISVREPVAQDAIEKLIGKRPQLVIDPSLLLNKKEYESIKGHQIIKKKYILLYLRHKDSKIVSHVRKMADTSGLQIVELNRITKTFRDSKIVRQPNPKMWLRLIWDAEYIFTDSFHGCAFCINLNKPFFVMISSANSEMSSRIYHILDRYGMKDRLITEETDIMTMPNPNFEESNKLLAQDREYAINYLKSALSINA